MKSAAVRARLRPVMCRLIAILGVAFILGACATLLPTIAIRDAREIAGTWRGRVTGPTGHAVASLTVTEDGGYRGTMYLDGGDQDFGGRITVIAPGRIRFGGSDGYGTVLVEDRGQRRLRFVHDGGGAGGVFTPSP